jgi:acylglycerol lipase
VLRRKHRIIIIYLKHQVVAPIFSVLAPKYKVSALHRRGPPVSRDPEALKMKYSDPLVYTGPIRVRTGNEILRLTSYLQRNLSRITVPFIVLHGTADTITDPRASQRPYQASMSTTKSIKLYDGYLHDLLFEPERDDIANDIINWLSARLDVGWMFFRDGELNRSQGSSTSSEMVSIEQCNCKIAWF